MTHVRQPAYWPTSGWRWSTPQEQGIDPIALARAAHEARHNLPTLYSLLVIRNGYIVFEEHFRGHAPTDLYSVRSVTKSVTSALVGIAYQARYLAGLDQAVAELLPEHIGTDHDPRKRAITVKDLLTMQAGLRWEEADEWRFYEHDDWVAFTLQRSMAASPGARFMYNTGLSQVLSAILTKTTKYVDKHARLRLCFEHNTCEYQQTRKRPRYSPGALLRSLPSTIPHLL